MNFQPLIDNLPYILAAIGVIIWAASKFVTSRAVANPAVDAWDTWAPRIQWASDHYSEAIDWLVEAKVLKLVGSEKMAYLNELTADFKKAIEAGDYLEAINSVIGFYKDAKGKAVAANPSTPELTENTPAQ
ncbi:MAG: hypothetical protein KKB51_18215 [Candidatus Riflebacteria bacterium]|nr:hypothetical protein [Candidatus Riflebacteria bacterium]